MCAHILVAEDDLRQATVIRRYLEHEGHTVVIVHDGGSAIDEARRHRPDLLVLDVMMPVVDGLQVCRVLRRESELAILMLTARNTEDDLLRGLGLGADDFMTKPYSVRELMARIRTLLRRARRTAEVEAEPAEETVLQVGALTMDAARHEVRLGARRIELTAGEFRLLSVMLAAPDRVFTRRQLLTHTRGANAFVTERTIDVHILNLRKKIEPVPRRPAYLLTVVGVGYKLTDGSGTADGPDSFRAEPRGER
ncbi:DNA-binding response regulator [Streptomyces pluripotens]|uniref:DNA-binding response regulator n=1 Tax=Streptomyces pluripotens TaxID=1355015 RepID=A0A221P1J4_9ACTN|nr:MULTISPECIES: response regulator transcription factor [Streptomyces]ARP71704.1 DNA-binding response regulator [Streptomyces pluripotens]ASN25956.1 DNA-binding response regulator [Streptomyces pluripotens]KIE25731.1 XRE family transcriptional regulator [Streptomyces sp. MUSC 125]MCH0557644.1 response regulator transcription factor [Streptomyces sp. MUM 16J]